MTDENESGNFFYFPLQPQLLSTYHPNFLPPIPQLSSTYIFLTPYKASNIKPSSVLLKKARNYFRIK